MRTRGREAPNDAQDQAPSGPLGIAVRERRNDVTDPLAPFPVRAVAHGKAILLGEHAAVYGFPALAVPLKDVGLEIFFEPPEGGSRQIGNWNEAWEVVVRGRTLDLPMAARADLTRSLARAVELCSGGARDLFRHRPQEVRVVSDIPLGAGMGGSAAVGAALTRAVDAVLDVSRPQDERAALANAIDGLFHGNASGLDAATVVSDHIISFTRGKGSRLVYNDREFWLVLVDSGERAQTSDMVALVARARAARPEAVQALLQTLGDLVVGAESALSEGDLPALGAAFNAAHGVLRELGVSTPRVCALVEEMRACGALGAKVTGAGGGGLVLGLFPEPAARAIEILQAHGEVYRTKVPVG